MMIERYREHVAERAAQSLPPLPLSAAQMADLIELIKAPPAGMEDELLDLMTDRVPPGVDEAAYVKAAFLADVARGAAESPIIDRRHATRLLGTMYGGYNVDPLISLLDDAVTSDVAVKALSHTLLVYDGFNDVVERARAGSAGAQAVLTAWADAAWFRACLPLAEEFKVVVFRVDGETNTDDLSPAQEAWSRPDIPLHAQAMLRAKMPDAVEQIAALKDKGHPLAYVGDVVGTGSSRKSALNSVLWHMGRDIPYVPNKRQGGVVLAGKIAPIFFNTARDAGALAIECDVSAFNTGDVLRIRPHEGRILSEDGHVRAEFSLTPATLPDEVRAGGRLQLIVGRNLTDRARAHLQLPASDVFVRPGEVAEDGQGGFTLAQKMVGRACGLAGIRPGSYCEPRMATVGSQDTTGAMTRDELKELACLGFSADLVMQSFCHTAAYPKPVDIKLQHELPGFMSNRGGVVLKPGDGIIHSWLNRMILPDTVGTGGDSHTRFPLGISFPAGSGLVAFASALGVMPLDMPESVLVRFKGSIQPGVTLRDLVHAIPYAAIQRGLLTVESRNKKNVFSGRVLEIEGLPNLKVEQAFEFADASAERSANGCTVLLDEAPVVEFLRSNVTLLKWMVASGYENARTLSCRIEAMEAWLENPQLMRPDADARYAEVIEIDLDTITEPLLACPNDPDNIKPLSEVQGDHVDEVFIGSCMTNIGHYRAAGRLLERAGTVPTKLWIAPPTRMDEHQLMEEGFYSIFGRVGARTEMPGCSLCMGNQARVADGATVVSTSTRNFPNRMGRDANVYLASAELSSVTATLGRLPSPAEYLAVARELDTMAGEIYRYLNFDEIEAFQHEAQRFIPIAAAS